MNHWEYSIMQTCLTMTLWKLKKDFLTKLGILHRAEILAKNLEFSKKADIYYRLNRLVDNKFMGTLFKVMFVKKKKNKFKVGF